MTAKYPKNLWTMTDSRWANVFLACSILSVIFGPGHMTLYFAVLFAAFKISASVRGL